ncbi:FHIPEP family protein, partial [Vibrio parahaemolyticus V-223/04]
KSVINQQRIAVDWS